MEHRKKLILNQNGDECKSITKKEKNEGKRKRGKKRKVKKNFSSSNKKKFNNQVSFIKTQI